jgi:hypothetical protein
LDQVTVTPESAYPDEAQALIARLQRTLTACPRGFLLRYLALFGEADRFLYGDSDVVALMDWSKLFAEFDHVSAPTVVHTDEEYTTGGRFNYQDPAAITATFGPASLERAVTAGHFLARDGRRLAAGLVRACEWLDCHPGIVLPHDQTALHFAILIDDLVVRNLCHEEGWASSWAGDWASPLALIHAVNNRNPISHIHYSGGWPDGSKPIDVLLLSHLDRDQWVSRVFRDSLCHRFGINWLRHRAKAARRKLRI